MGNVGKGNRATWLLVLLLIVSVGLECKAAGIPSDMIGIGSGPDNSIYFHPVQPEESTGEMTFEATDPLMAIGEDNAGLGGSARSMSSNRRWMSSMGYVSSATGLISALAPFAARQGGRLVLVAVTKTSGPAPAAVSANDEVMPVPEPSALILAALAVSSAIVHLRRRQ